MATSGSKLKILVLGVVLGASGVGLYSVLHSPRKASDVSSLFQENVEYKFYSYATQIVGKQRMQVAKLQQIEVFERTSHLKAFWVDLPKVVVKAHVPVEYSFFVDMNQGWKFKLVNDEILVEVPGLTNSTPAVDIGKLKFEVVKGSILRNEQASLKAIQGELMGLLVDKSIEHRELVREQARTSITNFVKGWLSEVLGGLPSQNVKVRFHDEAESGKNLQ